MKKRIFIISLILFVIFGLVLILYKDAGRPKAVVAFVIDDWGYNKRNIDLALEIERPLTISILPNLRYSDYIAEEIRKNSNVHDIILHLPLESKSNEAAEVNTIRSDMEEEKIISILEEDLKSIPGIIGVSNHQGSKATEDRRVMEIILKELKKRGLFFLDSITTSDSVCRDVAGDIRIGFAQRDVFLDLTDQTDLGHFEAYIRGQIQELTDLALRSGSAIGIGHNKKTTLEVIKDVISELEKKGIKIAPLKKLVR